MVPWLLAGAVVVLIAGGSAVYVLSGARSPKVPCANGVTCGGSGSGTGSGTGGSDPTGSGPTTVAVHKFAITSMTPADKATGVVSNTSIKITFSAPVAAGGPMPTLSPSVPGTWAVVGKDALVFSPSGPFVPYQTYALSVPGGTSGVRSTTGGHLRASTTDQFTISRGSTQRLQQLLAQLGYLPLAYVPPPTPPQDMALPQSGTLTWRWTVPSQLSGQWVTGYYNPLVKSAVMMFETENGLTVDGIAGPTVWTTLLADVTTHKGNTEPVTYVLVTKGSPEHLTAWVNGTLKLHDILVNTGVPGATTRDGTWPVFEHVQTSDMKGCNVTGTCYTDPNIPWVSYFHGGDALHGYVRAAYGFPQSNGCVEMKVATADALWPYTPIGTLVTVQGTTATSVNTATTTAPAPTPATTTTTAPPTTTTTTAPPTTTTTTTAPPATTTTTAPPATTTTTTTTTTTAAG